MTYRNIGGSTSKYSVTSHLPNNTCSTVFFSTLNWHNCTVGKVTLAVSGSNNRCLTLFVRGVELARVFFNSYYDEDPSLEIRVFHNKVQDSYENSILAVFLDAITITNLRLAQGDLNLKDRWGFDPDEE